MLNKNSV
ncbi:hypothetical protein G4B88_003285 [Cannabis sativa]|nr:hypothetical protein G4B88_003285 [Cannabis sativa]